MQCDQVPRSSTILSRHLRTRGSVAATALLVFVWSAGTVTLVKDAGIGAAAAATHV
jgi:hypothetical protein